MSSDLEALAAHFQTPERKHGFYQAALSALFTAFPELVEAVRTDTVGSVFYGNRMHRKRFTPLKGNPGLNADGKVVVLFDETSMDSRYDLVLAHIPMDKNR